MNEFVHGKTFNLSLIECEGLGHHETFKDLAQYHSKEDWKSE